MKKIIAIGLIIVFMFNIVGCATVEDRTEKISNDLKGINKANEKIGYSTKNDGDRTKAGILGSVICGLLIGGGIAIYGISQAKEKEGRSIVTIAAVMLGVVAALGGFFWGELIYDNMPEK